MSCLKYMYFADVKTNSDILSLSKMWVIERDSEQAIRLQISNSSAQVVFLNWESARIKIGENSPANVNVRPNHKVSMIESGQSVFEVIPLVEFERSSKFIYPKTYLVKPETLKAQPQKVMLSIEVCEGVIEDGFRSMDCADGSKSWTKRILQGELRFGSP